MVERIALLGLGVLVILGATGCVGKGRTATCTETGACHPGEVCLRDACRTLCNVQADCATGDFCTLEGVCEGTSDNPDNSPHIELVVGNGVVPEQISDGLIVTGSRLAGAVIELQDADGGLRLEPREQTDARVEVPLPIDVISGDYTLVAINASGEDAADIILQLPEVSPQLVLERLNEATGTIDHDLLPIGATTDAVAAGDHAHDVLYYPRAEADSAFLTPSEGASMFLSEADADGLYRRLDTVERLWVGGEQFFGYVDPALNNPPTYYHEAERWSFSLQGHVRTSTSQPQSVQALIDLPHGATLSTVRCQVSDGTGMANMSMSLNRRTFAGETPCGSHTFASSATSVAALAVAGCTAPADADLADDNFAHYFIVATASSGGYAYDGGVTTGVLALRGCEVAFTK